MVDQDIWEDCFSGERGDFDGAVVDGDTQMSSTERDMAHSEADDSDKDMDSNADDRDIFLRIALSAICASQHRSRIDSRTRHDRLERSAVAWQSVYPDLARAFLHWDKMGPPDDGGDAVQRHDPILVVDIHGA